VTSTAGCGLILTAGGRQSLSGAAARAFLRVHAQAKISRTRGFRTFLREGQALTDWMVKQDGFELPVPLISYQNARSLPVSFSPSALLDSNGVGGTYRKRPRLA
jgi:hypothetical protein